jgi:hypothetical protein
MAGTNHLLKQESELGFAVTSIESLKVGTDYLIVDRGLDEWNGGYRYRGLDKSGNYHIFEDMLEAPGSEKRGLWVYSQAEMEELIFRSEIANEAY